MALGLTQPHVKMSTRDVPGGKGGWCMRLTTYHHIVPMSRNLGALTLLDPSGPAWPVMGVLFYIKQYHLQPRSPKCKINVTKQFQGWEYHRDKRSYLKNINTLPFVLWFINSMHNSSMYKCMI
jgi:hypothetical protein